MLNIRADLQDVKTLISDVNSEIQPLTFNKSKEAQTETPAATIHPESASYQNGCLTLTQDRCEPELSVIFSTQDKDV